MSITHTPPALAAERAYRGVIAARRAIRSAAMEVDRAAFQQGADVQAAIESMVRAGTLLEQAEAAHAAAVAA
ncbi:hypothetical protein DQ353_00325 [Arthrobacter sp. AQ5-05]|uniref:hypothetical protein n=1 Tax=Arthrobacter sp. AQ5-05 TaxID=2184581 RepID=UPI000DCDF286|nr:hypothetical protein [Arthrobacter sp. AQ5-05]RAX50883.1 hypothetical protein DQ353_00325 [Arthrobacter sp. AQ5-05]